MTAYPTKEYSARYYRNNREKVIAANKRWRNANREKYQASRNEYAKRRRKLGKRTDREIQGARESRARYKQKLKSSGIKTPPTPRQLEMSRERNRRYREKLKLTRSLLPPAPKKTPRPRQKKVLDQSELERRKLAAAERKKRWVEKNRKVINAKRTARLKNNPRLKIAANFRSRLSMMVRDGVAAKRSSIISLLGCGIGEFITYLESLFLRGMSWDNYGRGGWEIDHVIPCSHFDLTDEMEQQKCFHYTNHQPLWATDNRSKGNRIQVDATSRAKVKEFIRLLA